MTLVLVPRDLCEQVDLISLRDAAKAAIEEHFHTGHPLRKLSPLLELRVYFFHAGEWYVTLPRQVTGTATGWRAAVAGGHVYGVLSLAAPRRRGGCRAADRHRPRQHHRDHRRLQVAGVKRCRARGFDWDLIRGSHQGQRPCVPRK